MKNSSCSPWAKCIPLFVLVGCVTLTLAGCGGSGSAEDRASRTTLERIQKAKVVRVGYANEAPYAYKDNGSGNLTGEAPEIARVVLKKMGVDEIEGVLTEFGSLIPGLKAGRFDVIAAGMYITPERCREIAFSNPSYCIGEAFAVAKGNPKNLHSYEDVKAYADATLGVVAGAVERGYARSVGIPDDRVVVFPDAPSALAGVRAGRVDAYAGTSLTIQDLVDKDTSDALERAKPFTDPIIDGNSVKGCGAFGFRKEDRALLREFNKALASFIGTPAHADLVRPFGFTRNELPGDVTALSLCGES